MSSPGEKNCHRCGGADSICTPSLSGESLCPNCHSYFVEELHSSSSPPRSTPSPVPVASPPTSSPPVSGTSSPEFDPPNSRNLSATHSGNVLDQQQAFWNLDVDAVIDQMWQQGIDVHRHLTPPAARNAVQDLPDVKVDDKISQSECTVCKIGFDYGMEVKRLPCNHFYHKDCILTWLDSHNTCPNCRFELPTDYPTYENQMNSVSSVGSIGSGSGNPAVSGSESLGVSGSEFPSEPDVSSLENQAVSGSESPGVSGSSDIPPVVSIDENSSGSSSSSDFDCGCICF